MVMLKFSTLHNVISSMFSAFNDRTHPMFIPRLYTTIRLFHRINYAGPCPESGGSIYLYGLSLFLLFFCFKIFFGQKF